jgi:hypothetical protein
MSSRKLFSIFSNSYTITFSSFDHTIPVPHQNYGRKIERAIEIKHKSGDRPYIIHESDWIKSLL